VGKKEKYFRSYGRTLPLDIFSLALNILFYMLYLLAETKARVKCVARLLCVQNIMGSDFGLEKDNVSEVFCDFLQSDHVNVNK
jgi:hypothetical protein